MVSAPVQKDAMPKFDEILEELLSVAPPIDTDWGSLDKKAAAAVITKLLHHGVTGCTGTERIGKDFAEFQVGCDGIVASLQEIVKSCEALGKEESGVPADILETWWQAAKDIYDKCIALIEGQSKCVADNFCAPGECPADVTPQSINRMVRSLEEKFTEKGQEVVKAMRADAQNIVDSNSVFAGVAMAGSLWNLIEALKDLEDNKNQLSVDAPLLNTLHEKVQEQAGQLKQLLATAKVEGTMDVLALVLLQGEVNETLTSVQAIRDDLQRRRDAAATKRNGSILGAGASLVQGYFMGKQAAALEGVVQGAHVARNLYHGAACVEAVTAGISHYNVTRLDEQLVRAKAMSDECASRLRQIQSVLKVFKKTVPASPTSTS